jgi:mannose-6-phosphate isomerase-like protein (cupin superfamily)
MSSQPYLVHVDDVAPENMQKGDGWAISEFRLPVTGTHGSATTIFHSIFRPGSTHAKHLHSRCDEIAVYVKGHGIVGQSDQRTQVGPGHCRLMPAGSPHFFHNETKDQDGLVIGFYMGAKDVPDTGYQFCGHVAKTDLDMPRAATLTEGILLNVADVKPLQLSAHDGWNVSDFRMPIGKHNWKHGSNPNAQFWMKLAPGDVHHKHRFDRAEVLYYVVHGNGIAGAGSKNSRVRGGHVHFIPRGVEHFIANTGKTDTLEIIGVYTGAGSIEDAGYVHTGRVNNTDLAA